MTDAVTAAPFKPGLGVREIWLSLELCPLLRRSNINSQAIDQLITDHWVSAPFCQIYLPVSEGDSENLQLEFKKR